jgi:hypothetical protein
LATEATTDTGGGLGVGPAANSAWALYPNVDFGSTPGSQLLARAASGAAGRVSGLVEVRLDSRTNAPIVFAVANTGGWQADVANHPGEYQRHDRGAQRVPHVHQRSADRLRKSQLVHLRPLRTRCRCPRRGGHRHRIRCCRPRRSRHCRLQWAVCELL